MPDALKREVLAPAEGRFQNLHFLAQGFYAHPNEPMPVTRARAFESLLLESPRHLYEHDLIAGSMRGFFFPLSEEQARWDERIVDSYGRNGFRTNADHFAPDYESAVKEGVGGLLARVEAAKRAHAGDEDRQATLSGMEITLRALSRLLALYAKDAREAGREDMARTLEAIELAPPSSFRQALQLVWMIHLCFVLEGRYAMALGRVDQYLYPFYEKDVKNGALTKEEATSLLEHTFVKILERQIMGGDDVVNIAIGGLTRSGESALNELSYAVLEAVHRVNAPGPNLSARVCRDTPDAFLDEALKVIGTGLGYPAMMNDEVNVPALARHGYAIEDARDYCMVGCIENFLPGRQPPWSDGRFNTPKYLELALNRGVCTLTGVQMGPDTGDPATLADMDELMQAFEAQLRYGAADYVATFKNDNERYSAKRYCQPFLSCFCQDCIARGLDINDGGAKYPSVHGAGCMGIATVADALAAVESVVFERKLASMGELCEALRTNFEGAARLRAMLLAAPKYGNGDEYADKYACWYVRAMNELFAPYRTRDGGAFYTAIASNVNNIPAGLEIGATPDGRLAREPVSDAASPTYGRDKHGPTAALQSLSKPDYTLVSCGTVVNQKYSPDVFSDERRGTLAALVRTYFERGGQEIQINSVSREVLRDAMEHPEAYASLVVRVSGFSAYFTRLDNSVQQDILRRTEHT